MRADASACALADDLHRLRERLSWWAIQPPEDLEHARNELLHRAELM